MRKPRSRRDLPPRRDEMRKRYLDPAPSPRTIADRFSGFRYEGSPKHKGNASIFDLEQFRGDRGDATMCDVHAGWRPSDAARIPMLQDRARAAGLIGNLIWTVDDNGWVYELEVTNAAQNQHHGFPLLPGDPVAELVARRFAAWATSAGTSKDKEASDECNSRYDVNP